MKTFFKWLTITMMSFVGDFVSAEETNKSQEIMLLAGVIFENKMVSGSKVFSSETDNDTTSEKKLPSSIKFTTKNSSQRMLGILEDEVLLNENNGGPVGDDNISGSKRKSITKKTKIKTEKQEQFIEGYKLSRDGRRNVYVHGEIIETNNGDVHGYLYDNQGDKTYIYGHGINDETGGIYAQDNERNEYILDNR